MEIQTKHILTHLLFGSGCDRAFLSPLHNPESQFFILGLWFHHFIVWAKPNRVISKSDATTT